MEDGDASMAVSGFLNTCSNNSESEPPLHEVSLPDQGTKGGALAPAIGQVNVCSDELAGFQAHETLLQSTVVLEIWWRCPSIFLAVCPTKHRVGIVSLSIQSEPVLPTVLLRM